MEHLSDSQPWILTGDYDNVDQHLRLRSPIQLTMEPGRLLQRTLVIPIYLYTTFDPCTKTDAMPNHRCTCIYLKFLKLISAQLSVKCSVANTWQKSLNAYGIHQFNNKNVRFTTACISLLLMLKVFKDWMMGLM